MASCPIIHFDLRIFFEKVCICTHGNIQKKDHRKVEKKSLNLILKVVKLEVIPLTTFFVTYYSEKYRIEQIHFLRVLGLSISKNHSLRGFGLKTGGRTSARLSIFSYM